MKRAVALLALALVSAAPVDDAGFDLVRGAPPPGLRRGDKAVVSLSLVPRKGLTLLDGGPVLVRLAGDGLKPQRALYRRDDAVDPRADVPRFELGFVVERSGRARLDAACTFYLCRAKKCRPVETTVSWELEAAN